MRIGVFAYNFEHKKTHEGLLALHLAGFDVACVLAADPVALNFYQSKIRVSPKGLRYSHPRDIAARLGIPYHVVVHNSEECAALVRQYDLDVGVILGARILKPVAIEPFKIGVLNMHPALLPENRGLDNLKWAILKNIKQGVSCHLIDAAIDRGDLILRRELPVYGDDTLVDIFLRTQNCELAMMVESLEILKSGRRDFPKVGEGTYFKAVPEELEAELMDRFDDYKRRYEAL